MVIKCQELEHHAVWCPKDTSVYSVVVFGNALSTQSSDNECEEVDVKILQ